jgi:RNA polymerase sigma factor (sigma-70 family)
VPAGDRFGSADEEEVMHLLFSPMLTNPPATPSRDRDTGSATFDTWGALMEAAQNGHGGAYRRLLNDIAPWLQRYFRRRLPHGDVDDAVQETLMAVHRRRHTFDPRQPFEPWLAAIAKRKWIDQLRGMARRAAEELPEDLAVGDHEDAVTGASVLARLLEELRPAQAQAITLVKVQGYSIAEASRETGQSPSAVKMNIHRGLARLSALVEKSNDLD